MYNSPFLPDTVYHVYSHANGSDNLFRTQQDYDDFMKRYGKYIYPVAETYAYCLMPNHFHLMIRIRSLTNLVEYARLKKKDAWDVIENPSAFISQQFSNMLNSYSKSFNIRYERIGSLFQSNVRRKEIANDDYFARLIAYIHYNPIHHSFCRNLLDWSYSSIHAYVLNKSTKIDWRYLMNGVGNKDELIHFHKELLRLDLAEFNLGGS
ncbi:MAG: hypothetical protein MUF42_13530 [Cytophagaceae bacterium]|jgi:REP element-mobilizing transposase RayT|nr:hypothetical protein [Cytophagaceae bacterium]